MTHQLDEHPTQSDFQHSPWDGHHVCTEPLATATIVFIVDANTQVRDALRVVLMDSGYEVRLFVNAAAFLASHDAAEGGCLLVDGEYSGLTALDVVHRLQDAAPELPAIVLTDQATIHGAVAAMRAGASDYLEKPVSSLELLASIKRALGDGQNVSETSGYRMAARRRVASLTTRQHQILDLVIDGHPSKNIAADLGISQHTVENHRAAIMRKCGTRSLPALVHTALCAQCRYDDHQYPAPSLDQVEHSPAMNSQLIGT